LAERPEAAGTGQARRRRWMDRQVGLNRGRISRRGLANAAVWCGACGDLARHPGRPRSTVRLPLRGARHSWPPWPERAQGESLRIAGLSETVRGQKPPQKQRRRRKPVCAVERRRACARVSSLTAPGRMPPVPMGSLPVGLRCGSRSDGSVQRRSAPPGFFRGQGRQRRRTRVVKPGGCGLLPSPRMRGEGGERQRAG